MHRTGTPLKMFPPCALFLFCPLLFLPCFPLRKLPLPFLTLEKSLYLRERDTGQGVCFMGGCPLERSGSPHFAQRATASRRKRAQPETVLS